jgi:hypothetical protein
VSGAERVLTDGVVELGQEGARLPDAHMRQAGLGRNPPPARDLERAVEALAIGESTARS